MTMGLRDMPYDMGYPIPLRQYRDGALLRDLAGAVTGGHADSDRAFRITGSNDQHCYLSCGADAGIRFGDVFSFGISHPCTAFDEWDVLYGVDSDYNVTRALETFF